MVLEEFLHTALYQATNTRKINVILEQHSVLVEKECINGMDFLFQVGYCVCVIILSPEVTSNN